MHEQKGVQGLLAGPLRAGVDNLDDMPLQGLYAQLTELRMNQPFHSLEGRERKPCHDHPPLLQARAGGSPHSVHAECTLHARH